MATLTDNTKVTRVDAAFAKLASIYVMEGRSEDAISVLKGHQELGDRSKVTLFDLLTKAEG